MINTYEKKRQKKTHGIIIRSRTIQNSLDGGKKNLFSHENCKKRRPFAPSKSSICAGIQKKHPYKGIHTQNIVVFDVHKLTKIVY
jgi:hypothetical protein